MCGIAGYYSPSGSRSESELKSAMCAMTDTLVHRGPDSSGDWLDAEAGIAFGHRRLSIIDLSPAGAQPMVSHDGRYVLCLNGEIYSYTIMRERLEAQFGSIQWRGHSDSEVLLESCARLGLTETLADIDGLFAFALWDRETRALTLVRDAFGEKPLYYGMVGDALAFASELRAIQALPGFDALLDMDALGAFFKYSYIPGPQTVWQGKFKLPPAHLVRFTENDLRDRSMPEPQCWWDMVGDALGARSSQFGGSRSDAIDEADRLLEASVSRRLMSDVPMGVLLSGGIDSTATTALMCAASGGPVHSFSIGMDVAGFNEAPAAKAVADHLGCVHTELLLSAKEVQDVMPGIAARYDEPFADSSQVPTFLVSQMAKRDVTVVLSGDGGDEIFGGYNRYFRAPALWNRVGRLPYPLRRLAAGGARALPMGLVETMVRGLGPLAPKELAAGRASEKLQKLARVMGQRDEVAFHNSLLATASSPESLMSIDVSETRLTERLDSRARDLSFAERAMLVDTGNYLPDDILAKVDRASMAVSLETRTPYLERDLFRFAWSLPLEWRGGSGEGKPILRELLYRRVPRELVDRPKAGFSIPLGRWLRDGLRDWAESELSEDALAESALLNAPNIRARWAEHLAGKRDHETLLWNVLMFQGWYRANIGK